MNERMNEFSLVPSFSRQSFGELPDGHVPLKHVRVGVPDDEAEHDGSRSLDRSPASPRGPTQRRVPAAAGGSRQQAPPGARPTQLEAPVPGAWSNPEQLILVLLNKHNPNQGAVRHELVA